MTQLDKVLQYLKAHHTANTNELRNALHIVDVPKAVSILIARGKDIKVKHKTDHTADYTYDFVARVGHYCFPQDNTQPVVWKYIEERDCSCSKPEQLDWV